MRTSKYGFSAIKQWSEKQKNDFSKELSDYTALWKNRGYEQINLTKLSSNKELSKSTTGDKWKFWEVYDIPGSEVKVGWKMGIWKGKVQEPFKIFVLSKGKEKLVFDHTPPPNWTFTGGFSSYLYLDPKKTFLLLKFGESWEGTYFIKLSKAPKIFSD